MRVVLDERVDRLCIRQNGITCVHRLSCLLESSRYVLLRPPGPTSLLPWQFHQRHRDNPPQLATSLLHKNHSQTPDSGSSVRAAATPPARNLCPCTVAPPRRSPHARA